MDIQSKKINKNTLKIVNKTFEQFSILECMRLDANYYTYDKNDEIIDDNISKIKVLLSDIYEKNIQKKCGWFRPHTNRPSSLDIPKTPEPKIPEPKTPENKVKPSVTTPPDAPRRNKNELIFTSSDSDDMDTNSDSESDLLIDCDSDDEDYNCNSEDKSEKSDNVCPYCNATAYRGSNRYTHDVSASN